MSERAPAARYESGRAVALGTLCRIFSARQQRTPFLRTYLEQFYACLARGARGEPPSLVAMLINSEHLFLTELEGVTTVVPDFVAGLRRVLPKKNLGFRMTISEDRLRRAAIRVLNAITAFANHFSTAAIPIGLDLTELAYDRRNDGHYADMVRKLYRRPDTPTDGAPAPPDRSFGALRPLILLVLLNALYVETYADNAIALLHTLHVFTVEDGPSTSNLGGVVCGILGDKVAVRFSPAAQQVSELALTGRAAACIVCAPPPHPPPRALSCSRRAGPTMCTWQRYRSSNSSAASTSASPASHR